MKKSIPPCRMEGQINKKVIKDDKSTRSRSAGKRCKSNATADEARGNNILQEICKARKSIEEGEKTDELYSSSKLEMKWIASACNSQSDFVNFFEKRLQSLFSLIVQSADSLSQIEKYMMQAQERDRDLVEQTLLLDDLQSQLTKLQTQCLEERRNYLGLVGDNEQLKLENEDLRRKFQAALLLGKIDEKAVTHFLQRNPKAPVLTDKIIKITQEIKKCDGEKSTRYELQNPIVLGKQVAFLEKHLENIIQQGFVEVFGLKKTLEHTQDERELIKAHYESRLKEMANRLDDARRLMHKAAEENLQFQKKILMAEGEWAKEQKLLVNRFTETPESFNVPLDSHQHSQRQKEFPALQKQLLEKLTRAEIQVLEKENIVKEYEMKFLQMERKMHRIKEECSGTKRACSELIKKLKTKNESIENRFEKIDERRKLDNAGFREDIKSARQLISTIEKKLQLFMYRKTNDSLGGSSSSSVDENASSKRPVDRKTIDECDTAQVGQKVKNVLKPNNTDNRKIKPALNNVNQQKDVQVRPKEQNESQEEIEKDRLIYEMLRHVLDSAKTKVNKIEKGLVTKFDQM